MAKFPAKVTPKVIDEVEVVAPEKEWRPTFMTVVEDAPPAPRGELSEKTKAEIQAGRESLAAYLPAVNEK